MKKQKNIKTFIISTKNVFGTKKVLEHIKNRVETEIDESSIDMICKDVKRQIDNK